MLLQAFPTNVSIRLMRMNACCLVSQCYVPGMVLALSVIYFEEDKPALILN
jgi:hypothetical protein